MVWTDACYKDDKDVQEYIREKCTPTRQNNSSNVGFGRVGGTSFFNRGVPPYFYLKITGLSGAHLCGY